MRGVNNQREDPEEMERRRRAQERRERRRRESRARIDRDKYREVEPESPPRPHRKRESRSYAPPPAYEEQDIGSDYHEERRQRRKERGRSSRAYEPTSEVLRDMVDGHDDRGRRHKDRKPKRTVAATPAMVEEGKFRGLWQHIRGGGGRDTRASTSYDSYYKEDAHYEKPRRKKPFWTRRKICKCAHTVLLISSSREKIMTDFYSNCCRCISRHRDHHCHRSRHSEQKERRWWLELFQ